MLKNRNVIFFANDWNADNKTSSHQIASILGKENRVLFVEAGGMRAPSANAHDFSRIVQKIGKFLRGARKIGGDYLDFRVASLLLIPLHGVRLIQRFNHHLTLLTVRYMMWRYRLDRPIVFYFLPHVYHLCGKLHEDVKVFYCIDEYAAFPGVDSGQIERMDRELSAKVDIIFVVSDEVMRRKRELNTRVYHSPHGVDIDNFDLTNRVYERPALLRRFSPETPLVMYWGLIADWMDSELLNYLVEMHPAVGFFLMGRMCCDRKRFVDKENLFCPGPVPYKDLASYAYFSRVLIIPFLINSWTMNINPLKLKEYLATGKPVISTPIPEALRNRDYLRIAGTKEAFSVLLREAIENPSMDVKMRQLSYVGKLTWQNRVEEISQRLIDPPKELNR